MAFLLKNNATLLKISIAFFFFFLFPLGLLYYYFHVDIAQQGSFIPPCLFKMITGYSCFGCGAQRALHSLLHGDILEALTQNALFILSLPFLLLLYGRIIKNYLLSQPKRKGFLFEGKTAYLVIAALLIFWIIRNLPVLSPYLST